MLALEEKTVGTFRSCLECWGMIRRAVDMSSEGKGGGGLCLLRELKYCASNGTGGRNLGIGTGGGWGISSHY